MLKHTIVDLLTKAIAEAQREGKLPAISLPEIVIERPQKPEHGDYASSISLKLARAAGTSPLNIANEINTYIHQSLSDISIPTAATDQVAMPSYISINDLFENISVVSPGFINFKLSEKWLAGQVDAILASGKDYGNIELGDNKLIQIEFVSVNPTGPLHVGHGRGAVLGSTLANILTSAGYRVVKEYYINDAGNQVDLFRRSLYNSSQGLEIPPDGYHGDYITTASTEIARSEEYKNLPEEKKEAYMGKHGLKKMLEEIRSDLERLRVTFDEWFYETNLFTGTYHKVIDILGKKGYLVQKEGATWFVSTALGEDKDNVVVRTDGMPTYFATDIAYHYNKFIERKFDRVINIWGADHAGHVSRMKAAVEALGIDPLRLIIIISQLVTLRRGGEVVKISKRSGDIITLRELIDEVGVDACRFFFLARTADSQMDFDLELAKKQSADNPVYYVQYAHARIASILRVAQAKGATDQGGDVSLLTTEPELTLIRKMLLLPEIVETIAHTLEPHHLTYYAQELATAFHVFYKNCRVVTSDKAMTGARLKLVKAAKLVLGRTLNLMGMNAPEKM